MKVHLTFLKTTRLPKTFAFLFKTALRHAQKNSAQGHTAKIAAVVILDAPVQPGEDLPLQQEPTLRSSS